MALTWAVPGWSFLDFFFWIFSKAVHAIRTKFSTVILRHIRILCVQWHQNRMTGLEKQPKSAQKRPNDKKVGNLFFDI